MYYLFIFLNFLTFLNKIRTNKIQISQKKSITNGIAKPYIQHIFVKCDNFQNFQFSTYVIGDL